LIVNQSPLSFSMWRKIAMATWRPRKDPMIWATVDIDATRLLHYIENLRVATGCHVTPTHLVGRAAARVFPALPGLNGRVAFGSFLPSPTIDCFFVVSLRTDPVSGAEAAHTDLSGAVVRQVDTKPSLLGVEARPYGSILVSNVGTYGLDSVSAPVPTFCHVPITVVTGAVTDKVLARDGHVIIRPVLPLTIGLDHRFVDGYQAAAMGCVFREYMDNPAAYDPVPTPVAPPQHRLTAIWSSRGRPATAAARTSPEVGRARR
jgi:hypothetical protein